MEYMAATNVQATMLRLLLMYLAAVAAMRWASGAPPSDADIAHCPKSCGGVDISYPFGIGLGCFRPGFELTCNRTTNPAKLYLGNTTIQIIVTDPLYLHAPIIFNIATTPGVQLGTYNRSWEAPGGILQFYATSTQLILQYYATNALVIVGCGIEAYMFDPHTSDVMGYCASVCANTTIMQKEAEGKDCSIGMGCCYIPLKKRLRAIKFTIIQKEETGAKPVVNASGTIKAFISYDDYLFSMADLLSDKINASTIGATWADLSVAITDRPNCSRAQLDEQRYACASNQQCNDIDNGGYYCTCSNHFDRGNPYIIGGCSQDYYLTKDKLSCSRSCGNTSIPFPFGLEPGCSANRKFQLNCTNNQALIGRPPVQYRVTNISVGEALLFVDKPSNLGEDDTKMIEIHFEDGAVNISEDATDVPEDFDFSEQSGVWKWAINNITCETAKKNTAYACVSTHTECLSATHGHLIIGYRCKCSVGYEGNPYVKNGCNDTNECLIPNVCNGACHNWEGGYSCTACPHGTSFDPVERQCTSTKQHNLLLAVAIGLGCGLGVLALILSAIVLVRRWKTHIQKKVRRAYFKKNKGLLLEQLISSDEVVAHSTKIFSLDELEKATNNFDSTRIVGRGGHGTVYKGILADQRVVAIKKSKIVEQSEIDQFVNEVAILSQIIHRNVVKLFGCCLESEVPLLVYEFISNGTLYDLLHSDLSIKCLLTWDDRIRIALEAASALAYLHSAASIPIFHRDVKSANILLNDNFTTKVSDFGASRSVSIDETHIVTIVQGTFGYLDPEYYHTGQLNEKSDVYSFGMILVELLTRKKPIFLNCYGEKQNLCHYFLQRQRDNATIEILDAQVIEEANQREIDEIASLADICLKLRGEERPTMKDVELRLQLLRAKITKKNPQEIQEDIEPEPLLPYKPNSTSRNQYMESDTVNSTQDGTRCYTMEQELVSWTDLPR